MSRLPELEERLAVAAQAWFAWAVSQIELRPLSGMIAPLSQEDLRRFRDALQQGALDLAGAGEQR
jgi:hypothetical protein